MSGMIRYGKSTQNAVAAMSKLAEVYPRGLRLSSREVADARDMPQTLAAKLLTQLSQVGLVSGSPGPGGGYALAKPPGEICLYDVAAVFERVEEKTACPFGRNWCGTGEKCPLHDQIAALNDQYESFLRTTRFDVFCLDVDSRGQ
jgi:Rrf2 family protein